MLEALLARGLAGLLLAAVWGCSGPDRPPTALAAADTADQVLFGLNHQLTIDGVLRTRVQADTADFFQTSQTALLRRMKVTFYFDLASPFTYQTSCATPPGIWTRSPARATT